MMPAPATLGQEAPAPATQMEAPATSHPDAAPQAPIMQRHKPSRRGVPGWVRTTDCISKEEERLRYVCKELSRHGDDVSEWSGLRMACKAFATDQRYTPLRLRSLNAANARLQPCMRLLMVPKAMSLAKCNVSVLVGGGRRAGLSAGKRSASVVRANFEKMSPAEMSTAMQAVVGDVRPCFGLGLVPFGSEVDLHEQMNLAHEMELISLVDKDGLRCVDIVNPDKLASYPELSKLHAVLQRIARFMKAGRSISSGGGSQAGGFRAHFRIVPHGRHSTPGTMEWGHLDSVCSLRVPPEAKQLYASDPQNTCAACRLRPPPTRNAAGV